MLAAHLAERDEALGGWEVLVLDAHAHVLCGQAQEAADGQHHSDVQPNDAKGRQRLPDQAALHPLQHCHQPGNTYRTFLPRVQQWLNAEAKSGKCSITTSIGKQRVEKLAISGEHGRRQISSVQQAEPCEQMVIRSRHAWGRRILQSTAPIRFPWC